MGAGGGMRRLPSDGGVDMERRRGNNDGAGVGNGDVPPDEVQKDPVGFAFSESLTQDDLVVAVSPVRALRSLPHMSALGIGCYYAWLYLACFSQRLFPQTEGAYDFGTTMELASFAGYLGIIAVAFALYRRWGAPNRRFVVAAAVLTCAGTAAMALVPYLVGTSTGAAAMHLASFSTGVGSGFLLITWASLFAKGRDRASLQIAGGFLVSFVVAALGMALPFAAAAALIAALPLASGCAILRVFALAARMDEEKPLVIPANLVARWLPWRLSLGLVAMGLGYGMAYQFAFAERDGWLVASGCLFVNALLGVFIVGYALKTKRNFGFSAMNLAILPLAGFAQVLLLAYHESMVVFAFLIMRVSYVMFDALLWLQLPKVYERMGTVRTFLFARLLLEGSVALGIVARFFIGVFALTGEKWIFLALLAFLFLALTLTFQGESFGTVWNLVTKSSVRTGKFRRACRLIEQDFRLTPRESEIMGLVLRGRNGTYIEEQLVISKSTFQTHMRNLYHKLDVHSNQELLDVLEEYLEKTKTQTQGFDR